jgi:hypothetical protein
MERPGRAGQHLRQPDGKINGASVLLKVRDGKASDWDSLCASFGINPDFYAARSDKPHLVQVVETLERAGLLRVQGKGEAMKLRLADKWDRIQSALGISLTDFARYVRGQSLVVNSWFGPVDPNRGHIDVFVAMPFLANLEPIYKCIRRVGSKLKLKVVRADDLFGAGPVVVDIWQQINSARLVLADCTGRNPNVFYEIGIAHAVGKPVILTMQQREDVPFDISHLRSFQYKHTPLGRKELESTLEKTLRTELEVESS